MKKRSIPPFRPRKPIEKVKIIDATAESEMISIVTHYDAEYGQPEEYFKVHHTGDEIHRFELLKGHQDYTLKDVRKALAYHFEKIESLRETSNKILKGMAGKIEDFKLSEWEEDKELSFPEHERGASWRNRGFQRAYLLDEKGERKGCVTTAFGIIDNITIW